MTEDLNVWEKFMMNGDKKLILLIEHDLQLRRNLRASLQLDGFRVVEAETGEDGVKQAISYNPDVVLLDLEMPDLDGMEVTKRIREYGNMPIIILSARNHVDDKKNAFAEGADDFLTKPFGVSELLTRIRVELWHRAQQSVVERDLIFEIDNLRVYLSKRQVFLDNKEVHLSRFEYALLEVFIRHLGKVITDGQLLKEVWGLRFMDQIAFLRVYMTRLRYKLREDLTNPHFIIREPGIGYRLRYDPQVLEQNIQSGQLQLTPFGKPSFNNEAFEKSFV